MNRLELLIVRALHHHRGDVSEATLARQKQEGKQIGRQLWEGGFRLTSLSQLRGKSVDLIRGIWKGTVADPCTGKRRVIADGVQAVRLSTFRKICKAGGKPSLIPRLNKTAGLTPRDRTPARNVGWRLSDADLARVASPNVRLALRLQSELGLRKKEAFLLDARTHDKGGHLWLDKGTKGRVSRAVAITTAAQRKLLDEVKVANSKTPRGTLVEGVSLKGAFDDYKVSMQKASLFHGHGLRHDYAQRRYADLIRTMCPPGVEPWECPKKGGLAQKDLSPHDRRIDERARQIVGKELGHGRADAADPYLGKDSSNGEQETDAA